MPFYAEDNHVHWAKTWLHYCSEKFQISYHQRPWLPISLHLIQIDYCVCGDCYRILCMLCRWRVLQNWNRLLTKPFNCCCSHQSAVSSSLCVRAHSVHSAHFVTDSRFNMLSWCWVNFCICGFYSLTVMFTAKM